MNKYIGIGNLTKDPELRYTSKNTPVVSFSIAINENYGENKKTTYVECIAWRKLAENIAKYCSKGTKLAIEGRLQNSSYEGTDGNKKYKTNIVVSNVIFLNHKEQSNQVDNEVSSQANETDPFAEFAEEVVITDEDLPF